MKNTIDEVKANNMCISCGLCKAVCPKHCVIFEHQKGMNVPKRSKECVNCGMCLQVCPGKGYDYRTVNALEGKGFWLGIYKAIYAAKTKSEHRLNMAVSGGVVTELVYQLLHDNLYESAFLLADNKFQSDVLSTEKINTCEDLDKTQKSRYLLVSHEKAVRYVLEHRDKKVILVGTSCFVQGLLNVIHRFGLARENYFIIGLFCDRTMTRNCIEYFQNCFTPKDKIEKFFFRTKEAGGWPGGVQIETKSGRVIQLPNIERMKVKSFFQPERCLYCLDKLNMFSDISVGDNYTEKGRDYKGSNSVIVRTDVGEKVWSKYQDKFEKIELMAEDIWKSQHLENRINNYFYAKLKEQKINRTINSVDFSYVVGKTKLLKIRVRYARALKRIRIGALYGKKPGQLEKAVKFDEWKKKIKRKRYNS